METIQFSTTVKQLHDMGALSEQAVAACNRLDADDAFTLCNYLTSIQAMYDAVEGDLNVMQELVDVSTQVIKSLSATACQAEAPATFQQRHTLTVSIDMATYTAILLGSRTNYAIEVLPKNVAQLILIDQEGYEKEDDHGNALPILYDSILFCSGRGPVVHTALFEIKQCYTQMFVDNDGAIITYKYGGKDWVQERVVYELGHQIETNSYEK